MMNRSELHTFGEETFFEDDRKILDQNSIELYRNMLKSSGDYFEKAVDFMEKYGDLRIGHTRKDGCNQFAWTHLPDLKYIEASWYSYEKSLNKKPRFSEKLAKIGSMMCIHYDFNIYMSESGRFYLDNEMIIAENPDDFLIKALEYDYDVPIVIDERIFEVLGKAGWYKGRKIDMTELEKECADLEIFLTPKQKEFYEEFGRLEWDNGRYFCGFYDNYIKSSKEDRCNLSILHKKWSDKIILIGSYDIMGFWLSEDGRLLTDQNGVCMGRTSIESLSGFFKGYFD